MSLVNNNNMTILYHIIIEYHSIFTNDSYRVCNFFNLKYGVVEEL